MTPDDRVRELLDTYAGPAACAADLLCDRHPADAVAFTFIEPDLTAHDLSYADLRERSERAARALADLGVGPGDRVATLMAKSEDLVITLMGIWRLGAVHVPLFTAFAPPAIALRLTASATKVVVVDVGQRAKLIPSADIPADAPWRVVVSADDTAVRTEAGTAAGTEAGTATGTATGRGDLRLADLLDRADPGLPAARLGGDATLVHIFTSGTTGAPKGVLVPVRALAAFQTYLEYGLDVRADDVFWNAADPGWAYGLYYGILGPLVSGRRSILLHAAFSPDLTWRLLKKFGVTNFTAAPTVYRALRAADAGAPMGLPLRVCSSAGEPLNPEMVSWAERVLGVAIRDHYGQTEHGMAIVNGWHDDVRRELKPGSMGQPMPGWGAEVLLPDRDEVAPAGTSGRVVIDLPTSPLMWFSAYAGDAEKSAERYSADGRWYYTGDAGARDADGDFFFSARDDDVIIMAGYRIGPFEVESVLITHPDVVECAVVGVPDELRGEVIEAYVVLRADATASPALATELQQLVKTRYAAHAYPRAVHFVPDLPKTPSSKIQRFRLRQRSVD
jgi:acetyl-CoA synthetase